MSVDVSSFCPLAASLRRDTSEAVRKPWRVGGMNYFTPSGNFRSLFLQVVTRSGNLKICALEILGIVEIMLSFGTRIEHVGNYHSNAATKGNVPAASRMSLPIRLLCIPADHLDLRVSMAALARENHS
ncbi:hypothetical protein E2C01_039439 [Portunus trituberculatus]|uniref:Uncharacterized protein n=1 Tax=Portunus trituberculatus TaxID=210409 RepID=A0A5B7FKP4_PORTR|nr:hypothetical protein [Portunus trituberculatus]